MEKSQYVAPRKKYKKYRKKEVPLTTEVKSLKRKLGKMERAVELKYSDSVDAGTIRASAGATQGELACLNIAVPSTGALGARLGQRLTSKKLDFSLTVATGSTAVTDYPQVFRVMLLWDKGCEGSFPFLYNAGTGSNPYSILDNTFISRITYAPRNHACYKRFKVLWDYRFALTPCSSQTGIVGLRTFTKTFDLKDRIVEYLDTTSSASIVAISTNSLIFAIMNDSGVDNASYTLNTRYWYTDE